MHSITKENLDTFIEYYHGFHDSTIDDIEFNFKEDTILLCINVFWSGEPKIKEDGTYETNKTKVNMVCKNIKQFYFKEIFTDYIDDAYIKYITIEKEELICFATDKEEPLLYIVCENIEYEDLK